MRPPKRRQRKRYECTSVFSYYLASLPYLEVSAEDRPGHLAQVHAFRLKGRRNDNPPLCGSEYDTTRHPVQDKEMKLTTRSRRPAKWDGITVKSWVSIGLKQTLV